MTPKDHDNDNLLPLSTLQSRMQKVGLVIDQERGHSTGEESTIMLRCVQVYLDPGLPLKVAGSCLIRTNSGQTTEVFHAFLRIITVKIHRSFPEGQHGPVYWKHFLACPLPALQHKRGLAWALLFLSTKGNGED